MPEPTMSPQTETRLSPMMRGLKRNVLPSLLPERMLILRGPGTVPAVALTFDDGPDEMTPLYLDLLDRLRVQATFFVIGHQAAKHPEYLREYLRRGHEVASHGYTHKSFPKLSREELRDELSRTAALLPPASGATTLVRPPHGALSLRSLLHCNTMGFTPVLWSMDSLDYKIHDGAQIVDHLKRQTVGHGEIMLLHEGQTWTLDALPALVECLRERGFSLVTLSRMLKRS